MSIIFDNIKITVAKQKKIHNILANFEITRIVHANLISNFSYLCQKLCWHIKLIISTVKLQAKLVTFKK